MDIGAEEGQKFLKIFIARKEQAGWKYILYTPQIIRKC